MNEIATAMFLLLSGPISIYAGDYMRDHGDRDGGFWVYLLGIVQCAVGLSIFLCISSISV